MTAQGRPRTLTRCMPAVIKPSDDELRTARRMAASHRRRRYPDRSACGLCGHRWRTGETHTGKPSNGCSQRRQALEVIDACGQLDIHGHVISLSATTGPDSQDHDQPVVSS
jgi:hypothetical protein